VVATAADCSASPSQLAAALTAPVERTPTALTAATTPITAAARSLQAQVLAVPEDCVPLAGSPLSSGASAEVAVGPAPVVPTPELPRTGSDLARVLVAAGALVAAGLVLLAAARPHRVDLAALLPRKRGL
jgi:LPXTG-motif cell wall-anchored protein